MKKDRNIYSLLNAISAIGLTFINGLLGIILTRFIIEYFGSDFNGINSTANQIINILLVLEGGFTLASSVSLFAPLNNRDYSTVNSILSATRQKFKLIGILFLCIGIVISIIYAYLVNSNLPKLMIIAIVLMTVIPQAFNLFFSTTYRVLLQAQQKEYIISIISTLTIGLGHIFNIIFILNNGKMWMIRLVTMSFSIINSILIIKWVKIQNKYIDTNAKSGSNLIKGTNDVLIQKATAVIYNCVPIVFLSISPLGGTLLASVYAVYNNIFTMIKSLLHAIIDAPRLGIGQMLTENTREAVWRVFKQYEYITSIIIFILFTSTYILILPFIKIYTFGINDINYLDKKIALLMIIIAFFEMLHIPSGHLINMAGKFKIGKYFQTAACIILLITMFIGGNIWGIYGMLFSLLITACALAIMEIGYTHICFFRHKLLEIIFLILPLILTGLLICYIESNISLVIDGYVTFFIYGIVFFLINTFIVIIVSFIFNFKITLEIVKRIKNVIIK